MLHQIVQALSTKVNVLTLKRHLLLANRQNLDVQVIIIMEINNLHIILCLGGIMYKIWLSKQNFLSNSCNESTSKS